MNRNSLFKKVAAATLSLAMVLSMATPMTVLAEEPTPAPTEVAVPAPTEEATPVPTEEASPVPTEAPTASPVPTEEAAPAPTAAATASPVPTEEAAPTPTAAVSETPEITIDTPSLFAGAPRDATPTLDEYIQSVTLKKQGTSGWEPSTDNTFKDGDPVQITLEYNANKDVITPTSKVFNYQLPDKILLGDTMNGEVKNGDTVVGHYEIDHDTNLLTITYTDEFAADSKSFTGTVTFECEVNGNGNKENEKFKFPGTTTPEVIITPNAEKAWDIATQKSANVLPAEGGKDKIQYTVDVTTTKGTEGTVTVADSLDDTAKANLTYDTTSVAVTDGDGNTVALPAGQPTWNAGNAGFTIAGLPQLDAGKSYHVTYITEAKDGLLSEGGKPKNEEITVGKNTVKTTSGSQDKTADIDKVNNKTVSKDGSADANNGVIYWTVEVNCNDKDIKNLTLTDTLPEGVTLADVSGFQVVDMNSGWANVTDTLGLTADKMFGEGFMFAENGKYRITYATKCDVPAPGDDAKTYTNTVKLGDHEVGKGVEVQPKSRLEKQWTKEESSTEAAGGHVYTWTSTIKNIKNGDVYTDWLAAGIGADGKPTGLDDCQSITADTWGISGIDPADYTLKFLAADGTKYATLAEMGTTPCKGFELTFTIGETIESAAIAYKTAADYSSIAADTTHTFQNTAQIRTGDVTETKNANHSHKKATNLDKKIWKNGGFNHSDSTSSPLHYASDLSNGILKYCLTVNEAGTLTGDQTITDTLPAGWALEGEPFYCTDYWNASTTKIDGITCAAEDNVLTFTVPGAALTQASGKPILIVYEVKTKIPANGMGIDYTNTATNGGDTTTCTQKIVRDPGEVLKKSSSYNAATMAGQPIPYSVIINPDESDLVLNEDTVTLHDTLSLPITNILAVTLQKDAIKLYAYDATKADKKGALIPANQYSYTFGTSAEGSNIKSDFAVTLADSKAYVLDYAYKLDVSSDQVSTVPIHVRNQAELAGETSGSNEVQYAVEKSSATASKRSSITIFKVDSSNYEMMLAGAVFSLSKYDTATPGFVIAEASIPVPATGRQFVTASEAMPEGALLVEPNTLYKLEETTPPSGYDTAAEPWYFALGAGGEKLSDLQTAIAPALAASGVTSDKVNYYAGAGILDLPNTQTPNTLQLKKVWLNSDGTEMTAPAGAEVEVELLKTGKTLPATVPVTVNATQTQWDGSEAVLSTASAAVADVTGNQLTLRLDYNWTSNNITIKKDGAVLATLTPDTNHRVFYTIHDIHAATTITVNSGTGDTPKISLDYTKPVLESGAAAHVADYTLSAANSWTATYTLPASAAETDYYTIKEKSVKVDGADVTSNYTVSYSANNSTGIRTGILTATNRSNTKVATGELKLKKVDAGSTSTVLKDAVFFLYTATVGSDGKWTAGTTVVDHQRATSGTCSFEGLSAGNYLLVETTAPQDYVLPNYKWRVTVTPSGETVVVAIPGTVDASGTPTGEEVAKSDDVFLIENSQTAPETVDVHITKAWNDNGNADGHRPAVGSDDIVMKLYANGVEKTDVAPTITPNVGNTWTYAWNGLPKKTAAGTEIAYTVKETTVPPCMPTRLRIPL